MEKITAVVGKVPEKFNRKKLPKIPLIIIALIFGSVGAYALINSFAATPKNGLLGSDPNFFPITVWQQNPNVHTTVTGTSTTVAKAYADMGVNMFTGLANGPTEADLSALLAANQTVALSQQSAGLSFSNYSNIIKAWYQQDEPDNAQPDGNGGYGPCINPTVIVDRYNAYKAADPSRPVILNLGQGVANTNYVGRGSTCSRQTQTGPYSYPEYAKGADILSFDVYPVNDGYPLTWVADGIENLKNWVGTAKPIWAFIEVTKIETNNGTPTPAQVKAEVWLALTHGASGIQYFPHIMSPSYVQAGIFNDQAMYHAVQGINTQIKNLAAVLNSPTVTNGATVSSGSRIDQIVKQYNGKTYLFAVNPSNSSASANFHVNGITNATATVIDESRTVPVSGGNFSDNFPAYGVHLYEITNTVSSSAGTPAATNGCTSTLNAGGNLQTFMDSLQAGDVGCVRTGTYGARGTINTFASSGTSANRVTLKNYPGDAKPTVLGQMRVTGNYQTVSGFLFDGPTGVLATSGTQQVEVWLKGSNNVIFADSEVRNNQWHGGVYISDGPTNVQILRNYIHDNGQFNDPSMANLDHGIYWYDGSGVIANNIIKHNYAYGVHLYPSPDNVRVVNNTITDHMGRGAIIISEESANTVIANNIISDNHYGIHLYNVTGANNIATKNLFWNNDGGDVTGGTELAVSNSLTGNPLFAGANDYHLTSGSPAINSANPSYIVSPDYEGTPRTQGNDIGAYEFVGTPAADTTNPTVSRPTVLHWPPPTLSNPITINIAGGHTINNLDPAKDYIINLPSSRKIGSTALVGGHNIIIKGGLLTLDPASTFDDANGRALYIKEATGTVHIEGVNIDNIDGGQGDAIAINAPLAIVQLENIRATNLKGTKNSAHADCVQPWGGVKELRIDRFTCTDMYQGLQIDRQLGDIGSATIKNTNLTNLPNTLTSDSSLAGGYSVWLANSACDNVYPTQFNEVYVVPKPGRTLGNSVWPDSSNSVCPTVASGSQVSWPSLAGTVSGSPKLGPPPNGDFVTANQVGLNYVSPGYESSSGTDPDATDPSVSFTSPANNATVSGIVTATAAATDDVGVTKVEISLDGTLKMTDTTAPYNYSFDSKSLSNGNHTLTAKAYDASGNTDTASITVAVNNPDVTSPNAPTNLNATTPNAMTVNLTWAAATDTGANPTGVVKYNVLRNGVVIAQPTATSYVDANRIPNTTYSYVVQAVDGAGNVSSNSNTATAKTPTVPDTTPPTVPANSKASAVSINQVNLTWSASTDDLSGIAGYNIYRNGTKLNGGLVTTTSYGDTTADDDVTYSYKVEAVDGAGNKSAQTAAVSASTPKIIRGDVTGAVGAPDGKINLVDVSYIIRNYDTSNPNGDISGPANTPDGKVDLYDLSYIIRNYGG